MKLTYPWFHTVLEWDGSTVQSLVIENSGLLYRFLCDLQAQMNGADGEVVVSEKESPIPIPKRVELLTDFIGWDEIIGGLSPNWLESWIRHRRRIHFYEKGISFCPDWKSISIAWQIYRIYRYV